jgi:hypothetical protein
MGQLAPFFAAIAPWLAAAGAGVAAVSSIQQGNQAYASQKSEQYARESNSQLLQMNASAAGQQAAAREALLRRRAASMQGEARAGIASTGTAISGSNLGLLEQSAQEAELDALTIRYEGEMERRGLMAQAAQEAYQARAAGKNAKAARKAGFIGAATSLLAGASTYGLSSSGNPTNITKPWTRKPGIFTSLDSWSKPNSAFSSARF